jgi:hypothetical protein
MSFTWDSAEYQYRDYIGRLVPRPAVRAALDDVLDEITADVEAASTKVVAAVEEEDDDDDEIFAVWLSAMETHIKTSNIIAALLAVGGVAQLTEEVRKSTADRIKDQYDFLRDFADEARDGLDLDERFIARSKMYALSGTGTFEEFTRRGMKAVGYTEERRHLASARPCASCIAYAGMGWQPIGTLPGIGQDCECMSNCRCGFEYRIKR